MESARSRNISEQIYYADSLVQVSGSEANFGGKKVPIPAIECANTRLRMKNRILEAHRYLLKVSQWATLVLSIMVLAFGFLTTPGGDHRMWFLAVIILLVISSGTQLIFYMDAVAAVELSGTFGKQEVLLSRRGSDARRIVNAINRAVADHGNRSAVKL